jgi:N-acetylmuramoyl-L-alanine amidase
MDTPSSNNGNYLVYAIGFLAAIGLILGIVAVTKISKATSAVEELTVRIEQAEQKAGTASDAATKASNRVNGVVLDTNRYFDQISSQLGGLNTTIGRLQADTKAATDKLAEMESRGGGSRSSSSASSGTAGSTGSAAAGATPGQLAEDGSYVIKSGDTFQKIAGQFGVSSAEIQRANPGVDPRKLHVGQKIVVPKKGN